MRNAQMWMQPSAFSSLYALFIKNNKSNRALSVNLCKPAECFKEISAISAFKLSFFEACQLWLSSVSRMKRQRPISFLSLFLTAPCNHLHTISNISDDRHVACSVSRPRRIPFTPLSLRLSAAECHVCSPYRKFCQRSEGCGKHVPAGSCGFFPPQRPHLRWDFDNIG